MPQLQQRTRGQGSKGYTVRGARTGDISPREAVHRMDCRLGRGIGVEQFGMDSGIDQIVESSAERDRLHEGCG